MKTRNFEPIFFENIEGKDVIIKLFEPSKKDMERIFGRKLETLVSDRELWARMCTHPHELPQEVYKILATIQEFGKERFRDDIVFIMERSGIRTRMDVSCRYLIAELLLLCPDKINILEAKKLSKNRRKFFRFFRIEEYPKEYGMNGLEGVIKSAAVQIADRRTSLGESVKVFAESMENDRCWQFIIKWCDKIQYTDTYDRKEKRSNVVILPVLGDVLIRSHVDTGEIEINIDSRPLAHRLVEAMEDIIWGDGEHHFEEVAIYDLDPLRDIGAEVLKVTNNNVERIILNMVEFHGIGESFSTRFGETSKTSDVTSCIVRLKDSESIDRAYFPHF